MNKNGKKDFSGWIKIKAKIHYSGKRCNFKEGEIWWCSVGENVGTEICGKGKTLTRPVIVFKKLDKNNFWAIPLTSKTHYGSWYTNFVFNDKRQFVVVSQIHIASVSRLHRKMGELSKGDYKKVYDAFYKLLTDKNTP